MKGRSRHPRPPPTSHPPPNRLGLPQAATKRCIDFSDPMADRLQKILSVAGIASRRAAEALSRQGRVSVNGETVTELGTKADAESDDIRVDGRRVKPAGRRIYILMNKPRGYITSRSDPQHRPTVIDLLKERGVHEYVYPV